jgi:ABC-type oligopeptide transport system substrate-binding subunit
MRAQLITSAVVLIAAASAFTAAAAIDGGYESDGVSVTFKDDGVLTTAISAMNLSFDSTYAVEDDTLTITSPADDQFCPGAVGTYTVEESDTGVTFTLIEDSCQQRADSLTGGTWTEMSE